MGLIKAIAGAAGGTFADQWREYFYCDSLDSDILAAKGIKRTGRRSANKKGDDNIISNGSVIAVADGQCMMIVEGGKIVEFCAEPGEFTYDTSSEPSCFYGSFGKGLADTFRTIGRRFTFGGEPARDERIYYFNTKEIIGNKYGTPNTVPFRIVDKNIGLDMDVSIKCFGEYSYKIKNPMLFYTNVCGNMDDEFSRDEIDSQLKTELMTALQPALAKISAQGIRYSELPGHTVELADALNEVLSSKWGELRGIEVYSFGVSSVKADEKDEAMIKELQRNAAFRNPNMAAAHLVGAQAEAMQKAAENEGGMGAMGAFMGVNMANSAGGANIQNLYSMGQNSEAHVSDEWKCSCGAVNTGKFCAECGKPRENGWVCSCGAVNKGRFCTECGKPKPEGVPLYKCDKCGWEPEDPANPPKFCPQCGDPFNDNDKR